MGNRKISIYQILTRLFGNKKTLNKKYGTIDENGVGKFNDITDKALKEIQSLGITHVWYTGVIEHALMTDYTKYGISLDNPKVVKGIAGSPYAIKDYYDVNPDLAVNVRKRMAEFEALIERTHNNKMGVIIDFVPNHVARNYFSDVKPEGIRDFGEDDKKDVEFHPHNNFYYIPDRRFSVPIRHVPPIKPIEEYIEFPAKVTGNDSFTENPSIDDWFETVKLNYGVDYKNGRRKYFEEIPSTWQKMRDILLYWCKKGVDGFRCDMAEMVPVDFWTWVITEVKKEYPEMIFLGEIYKPEEYEKYIFEGKFDFLYNKVGLYDTVRYLMDGRGSVIDITSCMNSTQGYSEHMMQFLENHDEQRVASEFFADTPWAGVPGMTVSSLISGGPVMIYFGQEVGEPGEGIKGFSGYDGRTTIFDYWGVPEHQKWMNEGKFDGGLLSGEQEELRDFYKRLLNLAISDEAIKFGSTEVLKFSTNNGNLITKCYVFLRKYKDEEVVVIVNFSRNEHGYISVNVPVDYENIGKGAIFEELLYKEKSHEVFGGESQSITLTVEVKEMSAQVYKVVQK